MTKDSAEPQPTSIDKEALKRRYRQERDKRLRADGQAQYLALEGQLSHYLDDPYVPVSQRAPKTDHVTVAFIGGGFAGLVTGARLVEAGVSGVRLIDKAGDFGGTWYWNRYPGAQCDTASLVYMPLLEETGYMPSEKYAHAPEILEHCQRIGKRFGLYDDALFHTEVTELRWEDAASHWHVRTNRGDDFTAQFVGIGTGILHVPKLPGIPGIESFTGHSFHTTRWDYDYTGGGPKGSPMERLADKRVGIIGTGATSVQCVPHLARACRELFVFQRTPSSVDERNNEPIDPKWFAEIATEGWQQRWLENFTENQTGGRARQDYVMDGWTDVTERVRQQIRKIPREQRTQETLLEAFENADFEKMEQIRARVDAVVEDPTTAQKLKAWYRQFCKRPCFHDEYLQAYNLPSTHLVDTDGKGVERVTERGVVASGVEYPLDCIIYASGFDTGSEHTHRMGFDVVGRDGLQLAQHWAEGMRTKHGTHVHGFPNLFIVQPGQGANLIANVPHNLLEAGKTIAMIVRHTTSGGYSQVEVTKQAEDAWLELLGTGFAGIMSREDCTPGYYNNEGQPEQAAWLASGYPMGPVAYFKYLDQWRSSGDFEGLEFR